jgi:hypothetical protein
LKDAKKQETLTSSGKEYHKLMAIYKKKLGGMQACCNERPNGKYL